MYKFKLRTFKENESLYPDELSEIKLFFKDYQDKSFVLRILYTLFNIFGNTKIKEIVKIHDDIVSKFSKIYLHKDMYCIDHILISQSYINYEKCLKFLFKREYCNGEKILENPVLLIDFNLNCYLYTDKFNCNNININKAFDVLENYLFNNRFLKDKKYLFNSKFTTYNICQNFFKQYNICDKELDFLPNTKQNFKIDCKDNYFFITKKESKLKDFISKINICLN